MIRLAKLAVFSLFLTVFAAAAQAVPAPTVIVPSAASPGQRVQVFVSGFAPNVLVDLYAGPAQVCMLVTNALGNQSCAFNLPRVYSPDPFWITAVERATHLAAQQSLVLRTNWSQFHGPNANHAGNNTREVTIGPGNVGTLHSFWRVGSGGSETFASAPVIFDRTAYGVTTAGKLYGVDLRSGTLRAGYPVQMVGAFGSSSPAVSVTGNLFVGAAVATVPKLQGIVLSTGVPVPGFPVTLTGCPSSTVPGRPVVTGNAVYVTCSNKIFGFDIGSGTLLPHFPIIAGSTPLTGAPAILGREIIAVSKTGSVFVFSLDTGAAIRTLNASLSVGATTGVVAYGQNAYVVRSGATTAVPLAPLAAPLNSTHCPTPSSAVSDNFEPAIGQGLVIASATDTTCAFDLGAGSDGLPTPAWSSSYALFRTSTRPTMAPIIANGVVYAGHQAGLRALSASSGRRLWATGVEAAGAAIADGTLVVTTKGGYMVGFTVNGDIPGSEAAQRVSARPSIHRLKPTFIASPRGR